MLINFSKVSKSYKIRLQNGLKGFLNPVFHRVPALNDLSFTVENPGITGLIGENGAGKSTAIKLLTGILSPDSGEISVLGMDPFRQRKQLMNLVGIVFGQRSILRPTIPVRYSYEWLRGIYRVPKEEHQKNLEYLCELFGITELIARPPRELSLGQRRKCDIVAALLHSPKFLFLDEPSIGLDFRAKHTLRELLVRYVRENNVAAIISSHDLNELENMCDNFLIVSHGSLQFSGTREDIEHEMDLNNLLYVETEGPSDVPIEESLSGLRQFATSVVQEGDTLKIAFNDSVDRIMKLLYDGFKVRDIKVQRKSLEDALVVGDTR